MRIGSHDVGETVLVVAEIGNNHEGDAGRAREMVQAAAESGADAVKLQTFDTDHYVSPLDARRYAQLKSFELGGEVLEELAGLARDQGTLFMSTPFDLGSVALLEPLVDAFKVASGDLDFFPLVRRVAETSKPMVLSTGVSDDARIDAGVALVEEVRGPGAELALLHCISCYPAEPGDLNLASIPYLAGRLAYPVGFSDHSKGLDAAVVAVALGARIVEKHFTLEGIESDFRDHDLSATPGEFRELVAHIRATEAMLGEPGKRIESCEQQVADALRRSVAWSRDLGQGELVASADITWLRPAGGIAPGGEDAVIGRELQRPVERGEQVRAEDLA